MPPQGRAGEFRRPRSQQNEPAHGPTRRQLSGGDGQRHGRTTTWCDSAGCTTCAAASSTRRTAGQARRSSPAARSCDRTPRHRCPGPAPTPPTPGRRSVAVDHARHPHQQHGDRVAGGGTGGSVGGRPPPVPPAQPHHPAPGHRTRSGTTPTPAPRARWFAEFRSAAEPYASSAAVREFDARHRDLLGSSLVLAGAASRTRKQDRISTALIHGLAKPLDVVDVPAAGLRQPSSTI